MNDSRCVYACTGERPRECEQLKMCVSAWGNRWSNYRVFVWFAVPDGVCVCVRLRQWQTATAESHASARAIPPVLVCTGVCVHTATATVRPQVARPSAREAARARVCVCAHGSASWATAFCTAPRIRHRATDGGRGAGGAGRVRGNSSRCRRCPLAWGRTRARQGPHP